MSKKILYGVQATGGGHITRSKQIITELIQQGHQVIPVISGFAKEDYKNDKQRDQITQVWQNVARGLTFYKTIDNEISIFKTVINNNVFSIIREIISIAKLIKRENIDFVISDYEPTTAWSAKLTGTPSISISHQASFKSNKTPRPHKKSFLGELVLKYFAPTDFDIGLHIQSYDDFILPAIAPDNVDADSDNKIKNSVVVYLPSVPINDQILELNNLPYNFKKTIYSSGINKISKFGDITLKPLSDEFKKDLAQSEFVLTGCGFETIIEALYFQTRVICYPIQNQYEQECNAAAYRGFFNYDCVLNEFDSSNILSTMLVAKSSKMQYMKYSSIDEIIEKIFDIIT